MTDQEIQIRQKYGNELPDIIFNLLIDVRRDVKSLLRDIDKTDKSKMIEDCSYDLGLLAALDKIDNYIRRVM